MPDPQTPTTPEEGKIIPTGGPETVTIEPVLKKGQVEAFTKKAWAASPPYWLVIVLRTWFFSASAASAFIGGTDYFTGAQAKAILVWMGLVGILLAGFGQAIGVVPSTQEKKTD